MSEDNKEYRDRIKKVGPVRRHSFCLENNVGILGNSNKGKKDKKKDL